MSELIKNLEITALTYGGRGIGRHDGKAVFVPLTAPGDIVVCRVKRAKKKFIEAELVEVARSAQLRRDPPCPYFGDCGGCQWQHLPYESQLSWKERLVLDHLVRNGIMTEDKLLPIIPSDKQWLYRNRVQFKCHRGRDGLVLGFYRHGSHFVVDVEHCRLLSPQIQEVYQLLRQELPASPHPNSVPQVDIAVGDDGAVRIVLHVLPAVLVEMRPWLEQFASRHQVGGCIQSGRKGTLEVVCGSPSLLVELAEQEMTLEYGPGGFAQVNSRQNRNMIDEMLDRLELSGAEVVLDLFCGMGNFSLPLAGRVDKVVGVEDYSPSIDYARQNASRNGIANAEFYVDDAARFTKQFKPGDFDVIVLDPPRTGSYQAIKDILRLSPAQVLYVSCDPSTLARDLKHLVHGGYDVSFSRPFDLFPQTWHIETMTLLRKI